ncbi:MAG: hypothetical protein A2293_05630 [Elusimicrobia bacterium RIFOXYB2_FULL_49_7]|nr:MAG: hypothetical protein A2293_05630 [Elusimicrobia bacterium RIFOXYB2_FULL_49_7]
MKKFFFIILMLSLVPGLAELVHGETAALSALLTVAKENNAEIIAARERWKASSSRIRQSKTWDNPKLSVEYWSIPEGTFDAGAATEKMYGISQMIPFPGKLALKGRAANAEADVMRWEYRDTELKVASELRTAYARYYSLNRSIETYRQTADIMTSFSKVAESRYVVGQATQGEVLRAQVEAEKMKTMLISLEQEKQVVQAEINVLVGRNAESALEEPEEVAPLPEALNWDTVRSAAMKHNAEIGRVNASVEKGKWSKRAAQADYLPDFDVSFKRKTMDGEWAGSDIMAGISIPLWFWKQRAAVNELSSELKAAEAERKNTELMVIAKAKEAFTKLEATKRLIDLYAASVIPKSEQSLKVTQAGFRAGRSSFLELLDSVRSYLEFKLEYYNYIAEYEKDRAMLQRVVGAELTDGGKP